MMRKNNQNRNMKHRNNNQGGRRYQNHNNRGQNDAGNIVRQKHHATQQLGKYSDLARNAQVNGDRVDVEYYLQHVEHYSRVLADIAVIEAERFAHLREQQIVPGGPNDPNAAEYHASQAANDGGDASNATNGETSESGGEAAPVQQARPRQPRRHYSQAQAEPSQAQVEDPNKNSNEIPLPNSILPPV